jgi:hypothetical protein
MLGWRCLMDRVLYVLAEGAACGRGRRVDARRWGGLMAAVGRARLVVLRERGVNPGAEPLDGASAQWSVAEANGGLGPQCRWAMRCWPVLGWRTTGVWLFLGTMFAWGNSGRDEIQFPVVAGPEG